MGLQGNSEQRIPIAHTLFSARIAQPLLQPYGALLLAYLLVKRAFGDEVADHFYDLIRP